MPVELIRLYESGGVTRLGKGASERRRCQYTTVVARGKAQMGVPPPAIPSSPHKHLLAISPWRKTHGTEAAVETFNRSLTKHHFNSCSRSPHCVFFFRLLFISSFIFFILSFIFFSLYFFFFPNSGTFLFLAFSIFFNSPWNDHLFFIF